MASDQPIGNDENVTEADFQKALRELQKGEVQATALENQLSAMEAKIEALLAQAEREQQEIRGGNAGGSESENNSSATPK